MDLVLISVTKLSVDPSVSSDSDDTGKAITALQLLGCPASFDSLIKKFELDSHFQCFPFERNPSFSANCNVLLEFLHALDTSKYISNHELRKLYLLRVVEFK